jgi:mono/diheme cytochrome c family protein
MGQVKLVSISRILIIIIICGIAAFATAQDKPKGKPWPAPETAMKMKNPVKADDASVKEGKELYAQHCKSCHGAKGKGDGTKAEKLDISCGDFTSAEFQKMPDGEIFWKTTEGRKPMPSFKEKLSDNERWAVINYLRTLK